MVMNVTDAAQLNYDLVLCFAGGNIFSNEVDKYKFLQMHFLTFLEYECRAEGFLLTDNALFMVLSSEKSLSKKKNEEYAPELLSEIIQKKYLPYYERKYGRTVNEPCIRIISRQIRSEEQLLNCIVRLHLLPVKLCLTNDITGWYWSSFPAYQGIVRWDFLDTARVLNIVNSDRTRAEKTFYRYHNRIWKQVADDRYCFLYDCTDETAEKGILNWLIQSERDGGYGSLCARLSENVCGQYRVVAE